MLEVRTKKYESSLDNAVMLRVADAGVWSNYRIMIYITSSDSIQDIDKVSIILSVNLLKLDDFERKSFNDWRTEEVISIIMDICRCERMGSSM